MSTAEFTLSDRALFETFIGKRQLTVDLFGRTEGIPAYSANVFRPFGYVPESNLSDFGHDHVLWGIDGDLGFNVMHRGTVFATTDHCGAIRILNPDILPEYLLYQLELQAHLLGFDRGLRASLVNMRKVRVRLPVRDDGTIDPAAQREIVEKYTALRNVKARLAAEAQNLAEVMVEVPHEGPSLFFPLEALFDLSRTTNRSSFTRRFVNENPGPIPVYSASGNEEEAGYGYVADNLADIKYFEDILTWNIDGSKFRAFYRRGRFSLSEKVIPLILKPEWNGLIDYDYVRHEIDRKVIASGAAYQNKPGKGRIRNVELEIPAREVDGVLMPDIEQQRILAARYQTVEKTQADAVRRLKELAETFVEI